MVKLCQQNDALTLHPSTKVDLHAIHKSDYKYNIDFHIGVIFDIPNNFERDEDDFGETEDCIFFLRHGVFP